jgi:hypothetical protein
VRTLEHRWEEQIPGDPRRLGCRRCGAESDERGPVALYRRPEDEGFSPAFPACVPARGRHLPVNPKAGERCPGCGYGAPGRSGWTMPYRMP